MDALLEMLPLLIPILVLDVVLAVVAALHAHYRFGSKAFWLVVVVVFLLIGPITYFVIGRGEEK